MKLLRLLFFLSGICFSHLYSSELFFGPEFYHSKRIRKGGSTQSGYLWGTHFGWERLKYQTIYFDVEGYIAKGKLIGKKNNENLIVNTIVDQNYEGRLGYTLPLRKFYGLFFTPFAGYGYFQETNRFRRPSIFKIKIKNWFQFASCGFVTGVAFNDLLSFAIDFSAKYMMDGKSKVSKDPIFDDSYMLINSEMQYDLYLPLTVRCCKEECCYSFSLAPFYRYRHYGKRENHPFDFIETTCRSYGVDLLLEKKF